MFLIITFSAKLVRYCFVPHQLAYLKAYDRKNGVFLIDVKKNVDPNSKNVACVQVGGHFEHLFLIQWNHIVG